LKVFKKRRLFRQSGRSPEKIIQNVPFSLLVEAKVTWAFVDSQGLPTRIPKEWVVPGLRP
jgi:acyl-CoA thioester hydrolase